MKFAAGVHSDAWEHLGIKSRYLNSDEGKSFLWNRKTSLDAKLKSNFKQYLMQEGIKHEA
jgi:hypothetical protein